MPRWLAIVNPRAGAMRRRQFRERWLPQIARTVRRVALTDGPCNATVLAAEAGDFDGIAVVGGDGTVFEVLRGMDRSRQSLAVVPAGRGNSLARDLGTGSMDAAIDALTDGRAQPIDLLHVDLAIPGGKQRCMHAASTVAVGYVVQAAVGARCMGWLGRGGYAVSAALRRPVLGEVELAVDGAPSRGFLTTGVIVSNTCHLANFPAFPRSSLCDGRFGLMALDAGWFAQNLHNLALLADCRDLRRPALDRDASAVRLQMAEPTTVLVDGELVENVAALAVHSVPSAALMWHRA